MKGGAKMHWDKILFTTDFSTISDAALDLASSLARDSGATLIIAHIEEPRLAYDGFAYYGLPDPTVDQQKEMLQRVIPRDPKVTYEHRIAAGAPADAICRLAEEEQVDLIVMGSHGRTGVQRVLMGSVAEAVVRHANCPVLTYKSRASEAKETTESQPSV